MIEINKIYCGNTLDVLKTFPDNFIQCCVTSPPYYGLRDYGIDNQIGLEKTPEQYVQNLVKIFQEVKRVLKEDGTLWLNLGDSYNGSGGPGSQYDRKNITKGEFTKFDNPNKNIEGLKPKDLIGIPWAVAFALRYDGWYLRSDIIWSKGNPMPESVKDRPTRNHEYVFLLTKNKKYYFDQDAVREPYTQPINRWAGNKLIATGKSNWDEGTGQKIYRDRNMRPNSLGRNIRSVWAINTKPYKGAHFSTFPLELPEKCIKAGSRENSIVLDPFNGAGTTCLVAKNLNRQYIGIDLNPEYCKLAENRIK
jgi:DNA modification methylase